MTARDFVDKLRAYFAPAAYTPGQAPEIIQWVQGIEPALLPALWEAVKRQPLYGRPIPMIVDLEAALKTASVNFEAEDAWKRPSARGPLPLGLEYHPEECVTKEELAAWIEANRARLPWLNRVVGVDPAPGAE